MKRLIVLIVLLIAAPCAAETITFQTAYGFVPNGLHHSIFDVNFGSGVWSSGVFEWETPDGISINDAYQDSIFLYGDAPANGDHLIIGGANSPGILRFENPTTINSFQLNGLSWSGANQKDLVIGTADLDIYDSEDTLLYHTTIDGSPYNSWGSWLTVDLDIEKASTMILTSQYIQGVGGWWPSIDNLRINESTTAASVPEPATLSFLLIGMLIFGYKVKRP